MNSVNPNAASFALWEECLRATRRMRGEYGRIAGSERGNHMPINACIIGWGKQDRFGVGEARMAAHHEVIAKAMRSHRDGGAKFVEVRVGGGGSGGALISQQG